jgi:hypothetical protein
MVVVTHLVTGCTSLTAVTPGHGPGHSGTRREVDEMNFQMKNQ